MKIAALLIPILAASTVLAQQAAPAPRAQAKPGLLTSEPQPPKPAVPDAPGEADSPEKTIARFFAYIQRKEVDQAYDQLTRGTKIAERPEDVKVLKSKTKDAIALFGAVQGYEVVGTKRVGERLQSLTVLSLGKEFPLRWRFYFYKPGESWRLIDMRVDDRLSAMFEEYEERAPKPAE